MLIIYLPHTDRRSLPNDIGSELVRIGELAEAARFFAVLPPPQTPDGWLALVPERIKIVYEERPA